MHVSIATRRQPNRGSDGLEADRWGWGQFRNPEEEKCLMLEATTKQQRWRRYCGHQCVHVMGSAFKEPNESDYQANPCLQTLNHMPISSVPICMWWKPNSSCQKPHGTLGLYFCKLTTQCMMYPQRHFRNLAGNLGMTDSTCLEKDCPWNRSKYTSAMKQPQTWGAA
jgi:hypothetical protein